MSYAWEDHEQPVPWPVEKLFVEAVRAASKCGYCGQFGHAADEHTTKASRELRLVGRTYRAEVRGLNCGWFALLAALGFIAGVVAALLWKGLSR